MKINSALKVALLAVPALLTAAPSLTQLRAAGGACGIHGALSGG